MSLSKIILAVGAVYCLSGLAGCSYETYPSRKDLDNAVKVNYKVENDYEKLWNITQKFWPGNDVDRQNLVSYVKENPQNKFMEKQKFLYKGNMIYGVPKKPLNKQGGKK